MCLQTLRGLSFLVLISLCCTFALIAQSKPKVLVADRLINGIHDELKSGWKVLIRDGIIEDVGPNISIPTDAEVLTLEGATILPGFIDMHGHLYANNGTTIQNEPAYLKLYLAGGVTTIFSPGEFEPYKTLEYKKAIDDGDMDGPGIFTAGPYFDPNLRSLDQIGKPIDKSDLESLFIDWESRIDGIKVYGGNTEEDIKYLTKKADLLNIPVTDHLGTVTAKHAIELGVDGLEHGLFGIPEFFEGHKNILSIVCEAAKLNIESPEVDGLINLIIKNEVYLSPTIITFQSNNPSFKPDSGQLKTYVNEEARVNFDRLQRRMKETIGGSNCWEKAQEKQNQFLKKVHSRGGLIVTGTDPVGPVILPGFALHSEIINLTKAGITPIDAIKAATINGAKALNKDEEIGSIEKDKTANLVVVQGNPVEDISEIENVIMVIKGGKIYDPQKLRDSVKGKVGSEKY